MKAFQLVAGMIHTLFCQAFYKGQPDPGAKVCINPPTVDLTDAVPGAEITVDAFVSIEYSNGKTRTFQKSVMVEVLEPAPKLEPEPEPPVTAPAPVAPPDATGADTAPIDDSADYTVELGFDVEASDTPGRDSDAA